MIRLRRIARVFETPRGAVPALRSVDLDIERGEFVAIMGSSGSGKTTLLHVMGALTEPSRGEYVCDGLNPSVLDDKALSAFRRTSVGFVFQDYNLIPHLSLIQNTELPLLYDGTPLRRARRLSWDCLRSVNLVELAHRFPSQLSGGETQRAAIARAIVAKPRVLLADEPTGNLDGRTAETVMRCFRDLNEQGHTIVLATHDANMARHAHRVLQISNGVLSEAAEEPGLRKAFPVQPEPVCCPAGCVAPGIGVVQAVRQALLELRRHVLWRLVGALGLSLGIAAALVTIGVNEGAHREALRELAILGANNLFVRNGRQGLDSTPPSGWEKLRIGDALALRTLFRDDATVTASRLDRWRVDVGRESSICPVLGVDSEYFNVFNCFPAEGRLLRANDIGAHSRLCVLPQSLRRVLFPHTGAVGRGLQTAKGWFTVVGVVDAECAHTAGADLSLAEREPALLVPLTSISGTIAPDAGIDEICLRFRDPPRRDTSERIRRVLRRRHSGHDGFRVCSSRELLRQAQQARRRFVGLTGITSLVVLLLGAFGVASNMLMSVQHRVHEIGIRRAVGASRRQILWQFLAESVLVCFCGACLGTLAALTVSRSIAVMTGWPIEYPRWAVAAVLSITVMAGIVAGFRPAQRAAHLDPGAALRQAGG